MVLVLVADSMLHVKAEHHLKDLDDSDDLEDDDRSRREDFHHGYHPHTHPHPHAHPHSHHLMMKGDLGQHKDDCGIPLPATKPKIWSLADTAACKTPPPPSSQQPWCGAGAGGSSMGMGINGFALPSASAPYSRYSGFFNGGPSVGSSGFPEVQTDTPPQTPPNMKLPSVASNLGCFGSGNPAHPGYPQGQNPQQFSGGYPVRHPVEKERHEYLPPQHHPQQPPPPQTQPTPEETAFKPFYKK